MPFDFLHTLTPHTLSESVVQAGAWGPLLYIFVIALSVVISSIPGAPLAVVAGTLWPPLLAGFYTVLGGFGGALVAYAIGRSIGQSAVKTLTGKTLKFSESEGSQTLGLLVFITRLLPVFSFDLVSYGAGIAGLPLPTYAGATLFGMVPSTLLLTFAGDRIQFNTSIVLSIALLFTLLFVAAPMAVHRYNLFNIKTLMSWE